MINCPEVGDPGELVMESQSKTKGLRTNRATGNGVSSSLSLKLKNQCLKKMDDQTQAQSIFSLPPSFSTVQAPNRLEDAHPHWCRWSSLLGLWFKSQNILTDTLRIVLHSLWASLCSVKLAYKSSHHHSARRGKCRTHVREKLIGLDDWP